MQNVLCYWGRVTACHGWYANQNSDISDEIIFIELKITAAQLT